MNVIKMPMVSIIIPVYNGSKYMSEAINSALGQTYPSVEVIVINDGSRDDGETEKIAQSYGERIKYYYKENGGVATALNFGIEKMRGEYFSWLSHDDVYHLEKIEQQMILINSLKSQTTILYGGYELIDERSKVFANVNPLQIHPELKLNIPLFPLFRGLINGCTLLIHKSHFERVGKFDVSLPSTQDYDLFFKMFRDAEIKFQRGQFVKTRVHNEQGSKQIQTHIEECNKLWISMMKNVSIKEMMKMENSQHLFYEKTAKFLEDNTPYKGALEFAKALTLESALNLEESLRNYKISVIIPFYNRISLLKEAIDSVLNQTHRNIELILVDDGSNENIDEINKIVETDKRIQYIYQENKGVSEARNLGIRAAKGDYIAFLDSDDLFLSNKLSEQLKFMIYNDYDFSHTSYNRIETDGKFINTVDIGHFSGKVFPRIMSCCGIATPTVMLKSEIAKKYLFNVEFKIGEDVCLWIDLAYNYNLGGIKKAYTNVRIGHATASINIDKQRVGFLNILNHIFEHPEYLNYKKDIQLFLIDFQNLFKEREVGEAPIDFLTLSNSENDLKICTNCKLEIQKTLSWRITKPLRLLKKTFVSLRKNGVMSTLRKINKKIKIKFFK